MAKQTTSTVQLTALLADFRLLLILFVAFRLMMLMVYQPILSGDVERGVGAGGDRQYHYQLAALSEDGSLPFRDYWSEFPPVWSVLTIGVYQWMGSAADFGNWSMLLGLIVVAFDTGILVLIRAIGTRLHGLNTGMALAWIYAVMLAPLVFVWWNFDTLVAFFLLWGVWWLLIHKDVRSGIAIAIGALTKFVPALALGAAWRFCDWRAAGRITAVSAGIFILVYGALLIGNPHPEMATASLTAQFGKASYETVWALLDGNYRTGNFGTIESHFDAAQAGDLLGNPAVIPGWLRLIVAGASGMFVFVRTRRLDDKGLVAFVSITLLIFFLQAQGWSPQWLTQIIPLVLLTFPTRNGVLIVVMLSLVTFAEYPFLFIRTGDTGGEITGALVMPFTILVLARTGLLLGLCVALYHKLRQEPVPID